ncbi:MAG: DUF3592 domain-containing protein [Chloroflexi bacterium]|nr:DUF3592 domain-containing protein [Chloroflexota bacterium]
MKKKLNVFKLIQSKPFLHLITGSVIFLLGILISDIPTMVLSQGWPTTEGKIISHKFQGQKFKEYGGGFYTKIDVFIHYEYSIEEISYTSKAINSIDIPFYLYPESYADRYPIGKDVIVYYNPKDPAEALLEPGFVDVHKAFDVFSYLFFGAGIYFINRGISKIKKQNRDYRKIEIGRR